MSKFDAIKRIGNRATIECDKAVSLGGVGGMTVQSSHGIYSVRLPLRNSKEATMSGVCLDQITAAFPEYPLAGKVSKDIEDAYIASYGNLIGLPLLPVSVGGEVDFMVGIKYLRYHPEPVFKLPSGLVI